MISETEFCKRVMKKLDDSGVAYRVTYENRGKYSMATKLVINQEKTKHMILTVVVEIPETNDVVRAPCLTREGRVEMGETQLMYAIEDGFLFKNGERIIV